MPDVSTKDVDRELRRVFWPDLRAEGFSRRDGRTVWQDRDDQVNVVQISSFNSYNAGVLRISTFSFQVQLGVFPRCRTSKLTPWRDGLIAPTEHHCDFRRSLQSRLQTKERSNATIWVVASDGANIASAVEDAHEVLMSHGLPWFKSLDGLDRMQWTTENVEEGNTDQTWGMGRLGSPHRVSLLSDLREAARD